ncbi:unnamed protein product [Cercospora beticola]|nr:unnamed protein product [Cercospora beticola]
MWHLVKSNTAAVSDLGERRSKAVVTFGGESLCQDLEICLRLHSRPPFWKQGLPICLLLLHILPDTTLFNSNGVATLSFAALREEEFKTEAPMMNPNNNRPSHALGWEVADHSSSDQESTTTSLGS